MNKLEQNTLGTAGVLSVYQIMRITAVSVRKNRERLFCIGEK